jgi:hypothetical protein
MECSKDARCWLRSHFKIERNTVLLISKVKCIFFSIYPKSDCTFSGTRNSNLKFINIEKKHGKKKRRKIKRKRRKKRSIKSFKFLHNKKKKVKKIKAKNKKFRLKIQTKNCIKTDYLEVVVSRSFLHFLYYSSTVKIIIFSHSVTYRDTFYTTASIVLYHHKRLEMATVTGS